MLSYIPQIVASSIVIFVGLLVCRLFVLIWRWIGSILISTSSLSTQSLGQFVWMKTIPLLVYVVLLPFLILSVAAIIDFKPVSQPLNHYLSKLIGSPIVCLVALIGIALAHIVVGKGFGRKKAN